MKNFLWILSVVLIALVTYFVIHRSITKEVRAVLLSDCPELEWLMREYGLSDPQYQKIKLLHDQHDAECRRLCRALAECQKELAQAVATKQLESPEFQSALAEWRTQQAKSQDSIFKHMIEVSAEMEPEQGRRYRENVYKSLILPGRTPHINSQGEFNSEFILHLKK